MAHLAPIGVQAGADATVSELLAHWIAEQQQRDDLCLRERPRIGILAAQSYVRDGGWPAYSGDAPTVQVILEAFEETAAIRWWVGVQFHPEWMAHLSWALGLFTALIDASRGYSAVGRDEIETLLDEIRGWLRQHDRALHADAIPFALTVETQRERCRATSTLQRHAG